MAQQLTYCFVSPFSTRETVDLISSVFTRIGKVKKADASRGYLLVKYRISCARYAKMDFYVQRDPHSCKVRMMPRGEFIMTPLTIRTIDGWWDNFLTALFDEAPSADFGVTLAAGDAYIVGVLHLGSDVVQVNTSRTTGGSSLLGFLAGGALFGTAGAIVGGMSGAKRSVGHSFESYSDSQLAKVIYNNGRLWEGTIKKGSAIYNEIMVNVPSNTPKHETVATLSSATPAAQEYPNCNLTISRHSAATGRVINLCVKIDDHPPLILSDGGSRSVEVEEGEHLIIYEQQNGFGKANRRGSIMISVDPEVRYSLSFMFTHNGLDVSKSW